MSTVLDVAPGVEATTIDGEVLVFDGTMIHLMSGSGAEVWSAVDGRRDRAQIIELLRRRHDSAPGIVGDVTDFVDDLLARGLVVEGVRRCEDGFVVPDHVAWVSDGRLIVVLDLLTGERQTLSTTASRAWDLLVQGIARDTMLQQLSAAFPDAPPGIGRELDGLCDVLVERGLLQPSA